MNSWSDDSDYTPYSNRFEFSINLNDSDSFISSDFSEDSTDSISLPNVSSESTSNLSESDSNDDVINNNVDNSYIINGDRVLDDLSCLPESMISSPVSFTNHTPNNSLFPFDSDLYYTNPFDPAYCKSIYIPNMDDNMKNNFSVLNPNTELLPGLPFLGNGKPETRKNGSICTIPAESIVDTFTPSKKEKPKKRGKNVTKAAKTAIFKLYRELRKRDPSKQIKIIAKEIRILLPIRYPYDISCNS